MASLNQLLAIGDTATFKVEAEKDGTTWDLTGGTVEITFRNPSGTILGPYTATISNPTGGIAYYSVSDTFLDGAGIWARQWRIVVGSIQMRSMQPIQFTVYSNL